MNRDVSASEPSDAIFDRSKLVTWTKQPGVSTWLLIAGPGWGKTCAARLIANAQGVPQHWIEGGATALERLGLELGLHAKSAPETLALGLFNHLRERHPQGATVVIDGAEHGQSSPDFTRFMRTWLGLATPPLRTILTSRTRLSLGLARKIVDGTATFIDADGLRLTDEEVAAWLGPSQASNASVDELGGWPLGIKALSRSGTPPYGTVLLESLVEEELLAPLPPDLHEAALKLSLLASPSSESLPVLGVPPSALECLYMWGLLLGRSQTWHPLARKLLRDEWRAMLMPAEQAAQLQQVASVIAAHHPDEAIVLLLESGDLPGAVSVLREHAPKLRSQGHFEELARLAALFDEHTRATDPELMLVEGIVQEAKGFSHEAKARYEAASRIFAQAGNRPRHLQALNHRMRLAFDLDDFAGFAALHETAKPLLADGALTAKVEHLNLLGCYHYALGDEAEAYLHFQRMLDIPHFDQIAIAANHQIAATNLGVAKMNRGDFSEAIRHFQHAVALCDAFQFRRAMRRRILLHLSLIALYLGDRTEGERLYREQATTQCILENSSLRSHLLTQEGDCLLLLNDVTQAEAKYQEALAILNAGGGAERLDIANAINRLAIIRRRRGDLEQALQLHVQSMQSGKPWKRHRALFLMQWGLTLLVAGALSEALEKFAEARGSLEDNTADSLDIDILLPLAVTYERLGQGEAARETLAQGVALIHKLGTYVAPVAMPEINPELWRLLLRHGHGDLLAKTESLFPLEATAIRAELQQSEPEDATPLPPLAPPAMQIRSFGSLEVCLATNPPVHWPRKKAKALLGLLLFARRGLSREAIIEMLYADSDESHPERNLHDLTSALRKNLEPGLAPRQPSRYLATKDGWYHFSLEGVWWDVAEFERAYAEGKRAWEAGQRDAAIARFEEAAALYRADLLSEPALAEWFETERQRYRAMLLELLFVLSEHHLACGHEERGRSFTERILTLDPTNEEAHRRLMKLYAHFEQRELMRKQYEQCTRALQQAYGMPPSPETQCLFALLTPG